MSKPRRFVPWVLRPVDPPRAWVHAALWAAAGVVLVVASQGEFFVATVGACCEIGALTWVRRGLYNRSKLVTEQTLTLEQAFRAMRYFLEQYNEREPSKERIAQLLRWTEFDSGNGGVTFDPAQWNDWLSAVNRALDESSQ